jgi:hypothetical protein
MNHRHRVLLGIPFAISCGIACASDPNLLPNGDFSDTNRIIGWTSSGDFGFNGAFDATGGGASGSMDVDSSGGIPTNVVSSCFAVSPGAAYIYGGQVASFDDSLPFVASELDFTCSVYATTSCSGNPIVQLPPVTFDFAGESPPAFSPLQSISGTLPGEAKSATCNVALRTVYSDNGINTNSGAAVDNLFFDSAAPARSGINLDGYMSGNWYDPAQSGQGFQLEFTDQDNIMLAIWFVYTPDGNGQNWIFAQGPYDLTKNTVTLPAEILTGAKFPPLFSSSDLHATPWGTITFTFTDCNNGTASWNSSVPGYGSGSLPISRLTQISGTTCPQ